VSEIPLTSGGLSKEQAVEVGRVLREGWDLLRSLQFNKKASILRYESVDEREPYFGIASTGKLIEGLSNLNVYVSRVSTREVLASREQLELTDMIFIFYEEVRDTDKILYQDKVYKVIQIRYWDPDIGRSHVVGRSV